jgi:hypothetical protein
MSDPASAGISQFNDTLNVLGYQGLTNPNPYLSFTGKIPMAGFQGTPTDASGKPIQSFLDTQAAHDAWQPPAAPAGTTLNSTPSNGLEPMGSQARAMQDAGYGDWGMLDPMMKHSSLPQAPSAQPAAAAPAPQNPYDMRQAYLTALGNPGKVTTPGAVMQPGAQPTGAQPPSVLSQFLASNPNGGSTGAGGYSNTGFFNTLNQLKAQRPGL